MFAEKEGFGTTNLDSVQFNDDWKKYQMQFPVNKIIIDRFSTILFNSECMVKLVMESPMKPIVCGVATKLKNKGEELVNDQLKRGHE